MSNNRKKFDKSNKGKESGRRDSGRNDRRNLRTRDSRDDKDTRSSGGMNDVSWYAANAQLLSDSSSLSFNEAVGAPLHFSDKLTANGCFAGATTIPGIVTIDCVPAIGVSTDKFSPVNVAARNIYAFVRHANAGHTNYESADLMMYLLGLDSLYSLYSCLTRAYGIMSLYSVKNRYLAEGLVTAMGFDFVSLQANLSDFRYMINSAALRIGSFCAPAQMSYFARHVWMYSGLYLDAPTAKAQIYAYRPEYFMKFEPVESTQGGVLKLYPFPNAKMTFSDIQTYLNTIIIAMSQDEDMNIISGDILKAFGAEGVIKLTQIPTDYIVVPQYVPEVLSQIQNATLVGSIARVDGGSQFTQDVNNQAILYSPTVYNVSPGLCSARLFNSKLEAPTPADNMVASRLTVITEKDVYSAANSWYSKIHSCGSDIATFARIWQRVGSDIVGTPLSYITLEDTSASTRQFANATVKDLLNLEKFDMHPALRIMSSAIPASNKDTDFVFTSDLMDADNAVTIGSDELRKMHDTALLSMFAVPQMGLYNTK